MPAQLTYPDEPPTVGYQPLTGNSWADFRRHTCRTVAGTPTGRCPRCRSLRNPSHAGPVRAYGVFSTSFPPAGRDSRKRQGNDVWSKSSRPRRLLNGRSLDKNPTVQILEKIRFRRVEMRTHILARPAQPI
jgi:hypothetical protein